MGACKIENFFAINPDVLLESKKLSFEVYVYLQLNGHTILFKRPGDTVDEASIRKKVERGLRSFYIKISDRQNYLDYLAETGNTQAIQSVREENPEIFPDELKPSSEKTGFETGVDENEPDEPELSAGVEDRPAKEIPPPPVIEIEKVDEKKELDFNPDAAQIMSGLVKGGVVRQKAQEEALNMLDKILKGPPRTDPSISEMLREVNIEHSLNVAIYSSLFAMGLGIKSHVILQDLTISALFHDTGITQLNPNVLAMSMQEQSLNEKKEFERHVPLGVELMEELNFNFNPRVKMLVSQHHEKFNGSGYPHHLDGFKIDELSQVLAFADHADTLCSGQYDGKTRSLAETFDEIAKTEALRNFPEHFNPDVYGKIMTWLNTATGNDYIQAAIEHVKSTQNSFNKAE